MFSSYRLMPDGHPVPPGALLVEAPDINMQNQVKSRISAGNFSDKPGFCVLIGSWASGARRATVRVARAGARREKKPLAPPRLFPYHVSLRRGLSAVGSAQPCQG